MPLSDLVRVYLSFRDSFQSGQDQVELLHEAEASRDEAKRQVKIERTEAEQRAQVERADLEQRYHKLLQEHMNCGLTIARLEAQVAEYLAFMERFRSSLRREEHS